MGCGASKHSVGPDAHPKEENEHPGELDSKKQSAAQPASHGDAPSESKTKPEDDAVTASHISAAASGTSAGDSATGSAAGSAAGGAKAEKASRTAGAAVRGKNTGRVADYYELGPILGKGGFGEVKAATSKEDGRKVAIKIISKLKFAAEDEENVKNEVDLMHRVRGHPNVVELVETFEDRKNFYIVMELCTGGELMNRIIEQQVFTEKVAASYFKQMVLGMMHCHANGVVHRDLKPENYLFGSDDADAPLKLTDFGLSTYVPSPESIIRDACGSAYYIAPEVFQRRYTLAADVWSLGVILFLLLSGTVPFGAEAEQETEVYHAIQRDPLRMDGEEWSQCSAAARELVVGLLEKDPSKRYTLEQVLAHPWVSGQAASDAAIDQSIVMSMYNFNKRNKFKKQALKMIASTLSAVDVQQLRKTFHEIDTDNTGTITMDELSVALKKLDLAETTDVNSLMASMDVDGDGVLSYEEFLVATAERQLVNHQQNIWWAFCEMDRDGDGTITVDELRQVLKDESPAQVEQYMKEYDADGDGKIDYSEFLKMLLPKDLKYKISAY